MTAPALPTSRPTRGLDQARAAFAPVPGYLNAASLGLPPRSVVAAMTDAVRSWAAGEGNPVEYDRIVNQARGLYARLVRVDPGDVAVGSQVSVFAGMVAASLPDGAQVLCVDGDFSSMVYPFLVHADRGVIVRHVPIEALADAIGPGTTLVAFSLAQSACGRLVDVEAVLAAAAASDALTFCDTTQAAGWMPVDASRFDFTACSAYKWLCSPRGSAFFTAMPAALDRLPLRAVNAGWYGGADIWESCYGPAMRLADDAHRFDVSPAWLSWVGTVPALELFVSLDLEQVHAFDGGLADGVREGLGLEPCGRPVLSLPDPDGALQARLAAAGAVVAGRAGNVRLAFHLWNDQADVELALGALRR